MKFKSLSDKIYEQNDELYQLLSGFKLLLISYPRCNFRSGMSFSSSFEAMTGQIFKSKLGVTQHDSGVKEPVNKLNREINGQIVLIT